MNKMDAIKDLKTRQEVLEHLNLLRVRESTIDTELDDLTEKQEQLDTKMATLLQAIPNIDGVLAESHALHGLVQEASRLAEGVSCKVRALDLAKSRVFECMKRVDDILDLKDCVDGVQEAMALKDYEKAAAHVHRFLSLDENLLREPGPDPKKADSFASSMHVLQQASSDLQQVIIEGFNKAVLSKDHNNIERYVKLFPLLNLHSEGLEKFSSFVCGEVAAVGSATVKRLQAAWDSDQLKEGMLGMSINAFFESVAVLVDRYSPMVETHYGPGWLILMLQPLQAECDKHTHKLCDLFRTWRQLHKKLKVAQMPSAALARLPASERPGAKDIDSVLTEFAHIVSSMELYFQYLRRKLVEDAGQSPEEGSSLGEEATSLLTTCGTSAAKHDLISQYLSIENYFLTESYNKAVAMSTSSSDGLSSSVTDDLFFILQKCLRRASSCVAVDCVCTIMNHASALLITEFKEFLSQQLKTSYTQESSTTIDFDLQAMFQASTARGPEEEAKPQVALNDIELAIENIQKLCASVQAEYMKKIAEGQHGDQQKLDTCLANLRSSVTVFKALRQDGISRFCTETVLPKLKMNIESFSTTKWVVTQEEYAVYQVSEPYVPQLIAALDGAVNEMKPILLPKTFVGVADELIGSVAFLIEKEALRCSFNQLGGVLLEKELRSLISYASSLMDWSIRDKFTRLLQVATLLSLAAPSEVFDYWGPTASGPIAWRLTPSEIRQSLALRVDFRNEDIKLLKL